MSRRPDYSSITGETSAWTPPAWLFSESTSAPLGEGTGSARRNSNHPYFSAPIPPVPPAVRTAIEAQLTGKGQYPQEKKQINQLSVKLSDQRQKLAAAQEKVAQLEAEKEQGLRDIRMIQEENTQKALAKVEREMRQQFRRDRDMKEQAAKQALQAEFDERKRQRQAQYKLEDEEAARKRQKSEADVLEAVKLSESIQEKRKHVAEKREQVLAIKAKLEGLHDTRSEIVWLLKQVIKAEEKKKAMKEATKSPPKTTVSKQA